MEDQKNGFSRFSFERSGNAKTLSGNVKLVRKLSRICVEAKKKADRWMKSKWKKSQNRRFYRYKRQFRLIRASR